MTLFLTGLHRVKLVGYAGVGYNVPQQAHMLFQLFFAIITPALVSGAIVQRVKFFSFVLFVILWTTFVYDPLAHWVRCPPIALRSWRFTDPA